MNLKTKIGLWLIKDAYKTPTVEEIIVMSEDKKDIKFGEVVINQSYASQLLSEIKMMKQANVVDFIFNSVLFKWQTNILHSSSKIDLNTVRLVSLLLEDFEQTLNQTEEALANVANGLDSRD